MPIVVFWQLWRFDGWSSISQTFWVGITWTGIGSNDFGSFRIDAPAVITVVALKWRKSTRWGTLGTSSSAWSDSFAIEIIQRVNGTSVNHPVAFTASNFKSGFLAIGEHKTVFASHGAALFFGTAVEEGVLWCFPVTALFLCLIKHSYPTLLDGLGASHCHNGGGQQLHVG
jgi:hypothetical protein